jgi:uncharacterized protein (DUF2141 family)
MMPRKKLYWLISLPLLVYLGCAKQTSPTGGPKDTIPPRVISSNPAEETINFGGRKIEITFSEFIGLNNPKEQVIITPSVGKDFEITAKKKTVVLEFDKALEPNTTYTINFRDAVQDLTEKNPVRNFQFALSTGSYIDSLSISGSISNLLTGKKGEDATVAITPDNDTFNIFKHPATIFTKTDKQGLFRIDHLKPGKYFIYAITDKNKNLVADSKTEAYGFRSESLNLTNDTAQINIGLVKLDARPLKVSSARPYNTYFNIRTSKNVREIKLTAVNGSPLEYSFTDDQSNVKLFNTTGTKDSLAFNFTALDSIGNYIDTVLYAKYSDREVEPEKFTMAVDPGMLIADRGTFDATLKFSKPVTTIIYDSIYFEIDSLTRINFQKEDFTTDKKSNTLLMKKRFNKNLFPVIDQNKPAAADTTPKRKMKNNFHLGTAAFISVEGDSSKVSNTPIEPQNGETLSKIIYEFKTTETVVIQLLDREQKVVQQIYNKPVGQFENLLPGEYSVRVIIDRNKNQDWDPGNFYKNEEPEKIIYYVEPEKKSERITLKSNWEFVLAPMLITY